jgi:polysaccharide pyruvyl transferase WcaK-like protein
MTDEAAPKRVAITGTFDVANYGDLLFPLIADYRLGAKGLKIVPVSPTTGTTVFADAVQPVGIGSLISGVEAVDAILIGGGYIIHQLLLDVLREYRESGVGDWGVPALWLGATMAGALQDIPIAWNAPGVPLPFSTRMRDGMVATALRAADYVAVRDRGSAQLLGSHDGTTVEVVPDTALDLAGLWPPATLTATFHELLRRKSTPGDRQSFAVHFRARSLGETPLATLGGWIDEFARVHDLRPILIAIGPSLGDDADARDLSAHVATPHILLDDPRSLTEIAAAIESSRLYLGASFHGYVTAACYGKPGALVARPAHKKFSGLLEQIGRKQDLAFDWRQAFDIAARNYASGIEIRLPSSVSQSLDAHWSRIAAAVADPLRGRNARIRFLRDYLHHGIEFEGASWMLKPVLPRRRQEPPE